MIFYDFLLFDLQISKTNHAKFDIFREWKKKMKRTEPPMILDDYVSKPGKVAPPKKPANKI